MADQPLRVAFIITSMPVGGAEMLLVNMLRRFASQRVVAEVVCLKEAGPLGDELRGHVIVHSRLLANKYDVRVLPRLIALLRGRQFDAVVTVGAGDKMFWGRLAAWIAGVPAIASALHSTGWPDGVGRCNRLLTPITDAFIAVADDHARFLREFERFPAERVCVVRNGVDTERFCPDGEAAAAVRRELGLSPNAPLVGIVAALRPEKNHEMFVRVCRRIVDAGSDTHFLIVGDGPQRAEIERAIKCAGIAERVHLLGTRSDTPRLLAALDVFLLCSRNEASPVSILEALAAGVPVISTRVGSVAESVQPGETGLLVPVDDDAAMADQLLRLLVDPQRRQQMGAAGRRLVQRQGSLEAMTAGYARLLEALYSRQSLTSPSEVIGV